MIHTNGTLHILQILRTGLVLHRRFRAHDIHKAIQAREAVGKRLGKAGKLPHGVDKAGDVQAEGEQIHIVHLLLHDKVAAHTDDCHIQTAQEKLHAAVKQAHSLMKFPLGAFENLVGGVEAPVLSFLVGKSFGSAETRQA